MSGSKEEDRQATAEAVKEVLEDESGEEDVNAGDPAEAAKAKKKKSKKAKLKEAVGLGGKDAGAASDARAAEALLRMNSALKADLAGATPEQAAERLKKLSVNDMMTGMSLTGKNQKDMASFKFWSTQPISRFDDPEKGDEGPIKQIDPEKVSKTPRALPEGFEWCTVDTTEPGQRKETYELLSAHYVEDDEAMFRLNYSDSFIDWALQAPGGFADWQVGVRASKSGKLVAFITAIPCDLRVRKNVIRSAEVNFMCVHKKLRSKRLAPVLIEEITRRCYLRGIFQAVYTGGTLLPTPIATCRYYHRALDWTKLYEVGFSQLPPGSTKQRQISKYHVPASTSLAGFRGMKKEDVKQVQDLMHRYMQKFSLAPEYNEEEIEHWFVHNPEKSPERVVWAYVVEDPKTNKITDVVSFYCLPSAVIGNPHHETVKAAFLFYYATEAAFKGDKLLKERVNDLMSDTLVKAKKYKFDVFNALTYLDNPLFLEQQKFGKGDGYLHYYLYNYRTPKMPGGLNDKNNADEKSRGGVGMSLF